MSKSSVPKRALSRAKKALTRKKDSPKDRIFKEIADRRKPKKDLSQQEFQARLDFIEEQRAELEGLGKNFDLENAKRNRLLVANKQARFFMKVLGKGSVKVKGKVVSAKDAQIGLQAIIAETINSLDDKHQAYYDQKQKKEADLVAQGDLDAMHEALEFLAKQLRGDPPPITRFTTQAPIEKVHFILNQVQQGLAVTDEDDDSLQQDLAEVVELACNYLEKELPMYAALELKGKLMGAGIMVDDYKPIIKQLLSDGKFNDGQCTLVYDGNTYQIPIHAAERPKFEQMVAVHQIANQLSPHVEHSIIKDKPEYFRHQSSNSKQLEVAAKKLRESFDHHGNQGRAMGTKVAALASYFERQAQSQGSMYGNNHPLRQPKKEAHKPRSK